MHFKMNDRQFKKLETVNLPFVINEYAFVDTGELDKWLIDNADYMISDAVYGVRTALVYIKGELYVAYADISGRTATDISIFMRHFHNQLPKTVKGVEYLVVAGNLTVRKSLREEFFQKLEEHGKRPGFSISDAIYEVLDSHLKDCQKYIQFFANNILSDNLLSEKKIFDTLKEYGFEVPEHSLKKGSEISEKSMMKLCGQKMMESPYEMDGILISKNCKQKSDSEFIKGTNCPEYARICQDFL